MKKNITLYYVGTKGINFGDSINPIFFERILNIKVKRAGRLGFNPTETIYSNHY